MWFFIFAWKNKKSNSIIFFKKIGQPRSLFCLFSFFSTNNLQKNCRLQRDSNSDRWSRRRAHWPLDHHHGTCSSYFYWRILIRLPGNDLHVVADVRLLAGVRVADELKEIELGLGLKKVVCDFESSLSLISMKQFLHYHFQKHP